MVGIWWQEVWSKVTGYSAMKFIVIGYDGKDAQALDRRMAAREAHLALSDQAIARGEHLLAAALLNEDEQMCGSVMVVDFPSRDALDKWLETEPYIQGKVWEDVQVFPCKIPPSFEHVFSSEEGRL